MRHDLLSRRAGAQNKRRVRSQAAKNSLRQFDPGEGYGHRPRTDLRFSTNALAYLQRTLEHAVEHRPGSAVVYRNAIRFADLAKNFGFAQHHRIQASRNPEQMAYRFAIMTPIKAAVQDSGFDLVKAGEEQFHSARALFTRERRVRRHTVKFTAIAGRQNQGLGKNALRTQFLRCEPCVFLSKGDALAQLHWSGTVIQTYEND